MRAARLRAVDVNRSPMPGREPGPADLLEYLNAHPATLAQVLEQACCAREWQRKGPAGWARMPVAVVVGSGSEEAVEPLAQVLYNEDTGYWTAEVLAVEIGTLYRTASAACAAADLELRRQGIPFLAGSSGPDVTP